MLNFVEFSEDDPKPAWLVFGPETGPGARPYAMTKANNDGIDDATLPDNECQCREIPCFDKSNPPLRREYPAGMVGDVRKAKEGR